jgi:hypothetical protein
LAQNLEWIYLNQDRFIIVCAAAALKRLELLRIIPDIIITIDGQKEVILKQFEVGEIMYKNSIIISSIKLDEEVYEKIHSSKLFFVQDSYELFEGHGILTGVTVGDIGISLLLKLGCLNMYILGFDACISPSNNKSHDTLHKSSRTVNTNNTAKYANKIIEVKGNFRPIVKTFILYENMISNISNILTNSASKVYNLSDGAYFEHSNSLKISDITINAMELYDKSLFQDESIKEFSKNSKKIFDHKDIQSIKKEKKIINTLIKSSNNFDKEFEKQEKNHANSLVLQIIKKYLYLIEPYNYAYKNENLKNKQLQKLLLALKEILVY